MEIHSPPPPPIPDTIVEEREEHMVSPSGGHITIRKAHFLKPTATSSNGKVSELPQLPQPCLSPKPFIYDLKDLSEKVVFKGWKRPTQKWKTWVHNMHDKYQALWEQVGIYKAILSSRYHIKQHKELVLGIVIKWCLETNTFVFPWGEATITLEDVIVCWGFSVLGESVLSPLKTKHLVEVEGKLIKGRKEAARRRRMFASPKDWMDYFMGTGHELEHVAFLSLWLSNFVFVTSTSIRYVGKHVFPIAIHLAIVLVWVWERFLGSRPMPNSISYGERRIARWHRLNVNEQHILIDSHTHLNEDIHSFARCLRVSELVGLESIEQYLPQRVSLQFGMDQDLPGCFARCNGNPDIAWRNYSRPIQDSVLYIPSRLFESDVTLQHSNWWKQSMLSHCDVIRPFLRRPRGPRKPHVQENHIGNSTKENEDKGVKAAGDLVQEGIEDQLTIREILTSAGHNNENKGEKSESSLGAQSQSCSTMKPGEVNIESSVKDEKDGTLENISDPLPIFECQNVPTLTAVADKEDVEKFKYEEKQDAEVTENRYSIGKSNVLVTDDVKSNRSLKDRGEGSKTRDLLTLGLELELEARICRLEKHFAKLKK
ncbi:hypothetical protein J1N35_023578 [Gossypium stocksii]|uniref:Aminotransferase-like plant mobile domain-containing protein n=1 Tax=Gossypium stocksii TaxID=47602 RepID=A0A9D3VK92_9ROSI|nr:hypothetical protein J1N35_023578 [Gossypium stocksii]